MGRNPTGSIGSIRGREGLTFGTGVDLLLSLRLHGLVESEISASGMDDGEREKVYRCHRVVSKGNI